MSKWKSIWKQIESAWKKYWEGIKKELEPEKYPEPEPPIDPDHAQLYPFGRKMRASFLFDNAALRVMNITARGVSKEVIRSTTNRCVNNGDNYIWLYTANTGDKGGHGMVPTSMYSG